MTQQFQISLPRPIDGLLLSFFFPIEFVSNIEENGLSHVYRYDLGITYIADQIWKPRLDVETSPFQQGFVLEAEVRTWQPYKLWTNQVCTEFFCEPLILPVRM
jgi:hypothetical protein